MAERRMFSKAVTESDLFLDMPATSRVLYFHLGMNADDDGIVDSPKRIMRTSGATEDDMRVLISKRYVIPFESGVIVIRHWKQNNYIQKDRYHKTVYQAEFGQLQTAPNREYTLQGEDGPLSAQRACIQDVYNLDTETRLDETRLDETRQEIGGGKPPKRSKFTIPSVDEIAEYVSQMGYTIDPQRFFDYYSSNGWHVGKNPMRDWQAAVRSWQRNEKGKGGVSDAALSDYAQRL